MALMNLLLTAASPSLSMFGYIAASFAELLALKQIVCFAAFCSVARFQDCILTDDNNQGSKTKNSAAPF
jgi:hypothetical protein